MDTLTKDLDLHGKPCEPKSEGFRRSAAAFASAAPEKSYREQNEDLLQYQIAALKNSIFMPAGSLIR